MAIKFRKMVRNVYRNGKTTKMYNAKIVHSGVVTEKDIAKRMVQYSTIGEADVALAIVAFKEQFIHYLTQGMIIELGELGRFKASFKTNACEDLDSVNAKTVKNITCIYKPGKEIKQALEETPLIMERDLDENGQLVLNSHSNKSDKE